MTMSNKKLKEKDCNRRRGSYLDQEPILTGHEERWASVPFAACLK